MGEKTKKPTGLQVARRGNKFVCGWTIGDANYGDGQDFEYKFVGRDSKWKESSVTKTQKTKTIVLDQNTVWPTAKKPKISKFQFRVQGNQKKYTKKGKTYNPAASGFTTPKDFDLKVPLTPRVGVSKGSEEYSCTFSWESLGSSDDHRPCTNVYWESVLIKNSPNNSKDAVKYFTAANNRSVSGNAGNNYADSLTSSHTFNDSGRILAQNESWTRWFRVKTRGPAGDSEKYAYASYTYAEAKEAQINKQSVRVERNTETDTYEVYLEWTAFSNFNWPIDSVMVQYLVAVAGPNLDCPTGVSWTDTIAQKDTGGKSGIDAKRFKIPSSTPINKDMGLYLRVNTTRDGKTTEGAPIRAEDIPVVLNDPVFNNPGVDLDDQTFRVTVNASNNSKVEGSFLVVVYKTAKNPEERPIGIIPANETSTLIQLDDWTEEGAKKFGIYAAVGTWNGTEQSGRYPEDILARSENIVWQGGSVPDAPTNVAYTLPNGLDGTVRVTWNWTWDEANAVELSWADHPDAWESTNGPSTYIVDSLKPSRWNISGLTLGQKWYIRVRLIKYDGESAVYGSYSQTLEANLISAPDQPRLVLTPTSIPKKDGTTVATWAYSSEDGTSQMGAEICEAVVVDGSVTSYGNVIVRVTGNSQRIVIDPSKIDGWAEGNAAETHYLCVRVTSVNGLSSDNNDGWSDPVALMIAEKPTTSIADLGSTFVWVEEEDYQGYVLTGLPIEATVTGTGDSTLVVERNGDYRMARPDDTEFDGFDKETIAIVNQVAGTPYSIRDNFLGSLDDGAYYKLVGYLRDATGQDADPAELPFKVAWTAQAILPDPPEDIANVEIDYDYNVAIIQPVAPTGANVGDTVDIYRLSADKPELIYAGAEFGTKYVDLYPTIGEFGGHRIVYKTKNGDYIIDDAENGKRLAWVDFREDEDDILDIWGVLIDFNGEQIHLKYDIKLSTDWKKDFTETKYLGGSIQGDWNAGVSRTGSISTTTIVEEDADIIEALRRLANYPAHCHIRTPEGASFTADIQVKEDREERMIRKKASFSLSITRVESTGYDMIPYDIWHRNQEEEEE